MFQYTDPTGTELLAKAGALAHYQELVHALYSKFALMINHFCKDAQTIADHNLVHGLEARTGRRAHEGCPKR